MMRQGAIVLSLLLGVAGRLATAAPLEPALQQQLLGIYDSYNKAMAAGRISDAMALRTAPKRAELQKTMKNAKQKRELLEMAKMMIPDGLEVLHATVNSAGDQARVIAVASKTVPKGTKIPGGPAPGSVVHSELTLEFAKDGTAWKYDSQTFGLDPSKVAPCKDLRNEPESAYDDDKTVSMGGPIARVAFEPDHTVVVVRVLDEENCAFLPSREELTKHGMKTELLVPYAIVEIEGSPHRSDKQKVLVGKMEVQPED